MNSEKGENIMLLTDVVLRAVISITLTQTPAKESIYVGKIILAKDGKEYTFEVFILEKEENNDIYSTSHSFLM